jgi:hypothetical protein
MGLTDGAHSFLLMKEYFIRGNWCTCISAAQPTTLTQAVYLHFHFENVFMIQPFCKQIIQVVLSSRKLNTDR